MLTVAVVDRRLAASSTSSSSITEPMRGVNTASIPLAADLATFPSGCIIHLVPSSSQPLSFSSLERVSCSILPTLPHTSHLTTYISTMSSALKFLVGGYGKTITLFSFDAASKSLNVVKSNSGFVAPTWVEASASSTHKGKVFYAVSEENGQVKSLELKDDGSLEETGSVPTNGNPAHSQSNQMCSASWR